MGDWDCTLGPEPIDSTATDAENDRLVRETVAHWGIQEHDKYCPNRDERCVKDGCEICLALEAGRADERREVGLDMAAGIMYPDIREVILDVALTDEYDIVCDGDPFMDGTHERHVLGRFTTLEQSKWGMENVIARSHRAPKENLRIEHRRVTPWVVVEEKP